MDNFCRVCGAKNSLEDKDRFTGKYGICSNCGVMFQGLERFKTPTIKIKLDHPNAKMPVKKHDGDAGYDLFTVENVIIEPGEVKIVDTGIIVELPYNYELQIRSRSGLSTNLMIANGVGTADSGYRGHIMVKMYNHRDQPYEIMLDNEKGEPDRIAQMLISVKPHHHLELVEEVDVTDRNDGGFGHTGR